ncbi:hypothetical protein [Lonepinella sp. BR2882]|uniref:hypothetical protein n=1 Tax=Lonepinella sp. BR2882 TaxID=3095283 RepID=UPI003F6E13A8
MVKLSQLWFKYFEWKLLKDFDVKFDEIEDDETLSPLVYTFISHKMIPEKPREIIESSNLNDCNILKNEGIMKNWNILKEKIKNGEDINGFMSKKSTQWKTMRKDRVQNEEVPITFVDHLYSTTGIIHLHLRKNKQGGIGNELVFAICTDEKFYVLYIGNHSDLFKIDNFIKIIEENFEHLSILKTPSIDDSLYKKISQNPNYQMNFIYDGICDEYGIKLNLIDYEIDNLTYKVPFSCYCAYENEIKYIEELNNKYSFSGKNIKLDVSLKDEVYIISKNNKCIHKIPLPIDKKSGKVKHLCSNYNKEIK